MNISENTGIEWNAMGLQIMYHSLVLAMERTSATSSLPQEEFDQETPEVCLPVESNMELEGFCQGTQFMKPPENTNEPTNLAWVSPELVISSSIDCDDLQFPSASSWEEPLQGGDHAPGQELFSSVAADECSEIELAEDEQDGSLTSESLNGTSPSETSTIADCGFEALGYGDIAEAMFFDKNFQFCSIELDALFSSDGEVLVK
ncbi:hypothetical protein NW767_015270 [Fusarium falciforme]|nr:hypothetical protein NW767_015270 [Fusarium falciforme]